MPKAWDDRAIRDEFLKTTVTTKQHLLPDWCYVHNQLQAKAVTLQKLWQAYAMQNPKSHYTYNHFCQLYKSWLNERNITLDEYIAGEKLFTGYGGEMLNIANPETGELYAHIFIGFMEASEYAYIEAIWQPDLENWLAFHVRCFKHFGGTPKIAISDCLKRALEEKLTVNGIDLEDAFNAVIDLWLNSRCCKS